MTPVASALGISRPHLSTTLNANPEAKKRGIQPADAALLERIKPIIEAGPTSGYRRVTAHLRRQPNHAAVNNKRVYRVMRDAKMLLERYGPKPNRLHDGKIITLASDMRWCSDMMLGPAVDGRRVHLLQEDAMARLGEWPPDSDVSNARACSTSCAGRSSPGGARIAQLSHSRIGLRTRCAMPPLAEN